MIPMWLHGLYGQYGPRCLLSPERPLNSFTHTLTCFTTIRLCQSHGMFRWYIYMWHVTAYNPILLSSCCIHIKIMVITYVWVTTILVVWWRESLWQIYIKQQRQGPWLMMTTPCWPIYEMELDDTRSHHQPLFWHCCYKYSHVYYM